MRKREVYVTKDDLQQFKTELLSDLRSIISDTVAPTLNRTLQPEKKEWLRTKEVVKMLGVSNTTLQNLRSSKTLSCTKVGGVVYYNIEDIQELLRTGAIPAYRKALSH